MKCTGKFFKVLLLAIGPAILLLSISNRAAAQDAAAVQAELQKALATNNVLKERAAKLEAALVTLQAERDKNLKSVVELTDQLHQAFNEVKRLKAENAQLRGLVPQPPSDVGEPPEVDGLVTADPSGDLVEISLGTDDGLKAGHRLKVYRLSNGTNADLGRIVVVKALADKAICKIDGKAAKQPIQKGDRVTTAKQLETPATVPLRPGEPPNLTGGVVLAVGDGGEVEISFGAADGLRPGHRLEAYRLTGSEGIYVGRLEVVKTAAKKSICRSIIEFERHPVRKGDRVTSKL